MISLRTARLALALSTAMLTPSLAWAQDNAPAPRAVLPATSYTLPNGLKVIFHIDRSDPVVAVVLAAHVGSSRETPGRTGFAHMFEHLFFLNSENLGPGGLDKLSARVGGSGANGSTSRDWTVYNQEVPRDALEKMIWAEADKLGYFIKTVTPAVLEKEKQVVKNEKRQRVDNAPYGHVREILGSALYPADHPYSWQVIGSMADLDAAQLSDVQAFYRRWYVPNNSTLAIAGDFDPAQAKTWVEKYFGEIPRGQAVARPAMRPVTLTAPKSLMYEDSYAKLPMLAMAWPIVGVSNPDSVALDALYDVLTDGRDAPLTKLLVEDRKLTDAVSLSSYDSEIAGEAVLTVRAFNGIDLDQVRAVVDQGLANFARDGVSAATLARIKTLREASFYDLLQDVDSKATMIARYEAQTGDENFADRYLATLRALTPADIMRVFEKYLGTRPTVAVSAVPKGAAALALTGAQPAKLSIEPIVQGAEKAVDQTAGRTAIEPTPSRIDRKTEPPFGPAPAVVTPKIWQATAANGLAISGIDSSELPVASFALAFDGGQRLDDPEVPGAANLLARMLTRGTARRTPAELENALKALGAQVKVRADRERITLTGATLARNYAATMALVREMLLEPRWDPAELALAKAAVTAEIADKAANPAALAARVTDRVTYGDGTLLGNDLLGTRASVAALTMDDLKTFKARNLAPGSARFRLSGAVPQAAVMASLTPLAASWPARTVVIPQVAAPAEPASARLFFYDLPDAKQSVFSFTGPGPRRADADYYPATVMNYILGGGGFASRLTQELREGKGYTYGIGSRFDGWASHGRFAIGSPVRANVTFEAAELTRRIVADYGKTFTPADLEVTKAFLTKSRAFQFERIDDKLNMLALIGDYGLPLDYPARNAAAVEGMTVERIRALADRWLHPDRMTYVIVGDARTQAPRLAPLGLGETVMVKPE